MNLLFQLLDNPLVLYGGGALILIFVIALLLRQIREAVKDAKAG